MMAIVGVSNERVLPNDWPPESHPARGFSFNVFHIQAEQLTINNQQFTIINVTFRIFDNSLPRQSILDPLLSTANVKFMDHSVKVGCASRLFRG